MALLLALALLAAQWLGLVHRVVHGPEGAGQRLAIRIRNKDIPARVVELPFLR